MLTRRSLAALACATSLGLTVFTIVFGFFDVAVDAIALKLFTGIEKFEIMAIPCFILAGNFLTHGGVARRMLAGLKERLSASAACALCRPQEGIPRKRLGLMLIVIIMGSIFTPTEAAAVRAVCAFAVAVRVCKDIRLSEVPKVLPALAAMFAFILTSERIAQTLSAMLILPGLMGM